MKPKLSCLVLALGVLTAPSITKSQNTPEPPAPYAQLMSPIETKLDSAFKEIYGEQGNIQYKVLQTLDALLKNPVGNPRSFDQPLDVTLKLIGFLRIKGASSRLDDLLDFELDPATTPFTRTPRGFEFYPGARAFADVADKRDIESLFGRLSGYPQDEKHLRIYAWILAEVHGLRLARWEVEGRLSDETQNLKKRDRTDSDLKTNLQKLKQLLETDSPSYLILPPKRAEKPVEPTKTDK